MKRLIILLSLSLCSANINEFRINRLDTCRQASEEYKQHIEDKYIHNQDIIIRCATYNHLVYAYESDYWKSQKCVVDNNCFWIKLPTYDFAKDDIRYKIWWWRFLIFDSQEDWNLAFARLYMRFHLNKTINKFVNNRSMTDRNTYIHFMKSNYWDTYNIYLNLNK